MAGVEIAKLNAEVQKMVLLNQAKFNPDLDSVINDEEMRVLQQECDTKGIINMFAENYNTEIATVQGLEVESSEEVTPESRITDAQKQLKDIEDKERAEALEKEKKALEREIRDLEKELKVESENLEILQDDYQNGTARGASTALTDKQGKKLVKTMTVAGIVGVIGMWVLDAATHGGGIGVLMTGFGLGPGIAVAGLTGLAVAGGMHLLNRIRKKNQNSRLAIEHTAKLPQLIQEQAAKVEQIQKTIQEKQAQLAKL